MVYTGAELRAGGPQWGKRKWWQKARGEDRVWVDECPLVICWYLANEKQCPLKRRTNCYPESLSSADKLRKEEIFWLQKLQDHVELLHGKIIKGPVARHGYGGGALQLLRLRGMGC
jgi:hypothetical protein